MDQYPYGYNPYHGQPAAQFYPYQADPNLQPITYTPHASTGMGDHHSASALQSYEQNRSVIPGLAFGTSTHSKEHNQQWPVPEEPNLIAASHYYQDAPASDALNDLLPGNAGIDSTADQTIIPQADDTVEEGELSEGEYDDLYEPGEPANNHDVHHVGGELRPLDNIGGGNGHAESRDIEWYSVASNQRVVLANTPSASNIASEHVKPFEEQWVPTHTGRDRSGSYSPYLSPREVHHPHLAAGPRVPNNPGTLGSESHILASEWRSHLVYGEEGDRVSPPTLNGNGIQNSALFRAKNDAGMAGRPPANALADAKKKAQAAILNLLPLEVKYQNYVEEGIDEAIVQSLFVELGLDTAFPLLPNSESPHSPSTLLQPQPSFPIPPPPIEQSRTSQALQTPIPTTGTQAMKDSTTPQDKSEERKDRIARLLAAKGTKLSASTGAPSTAGSIPTPVQRQAANSQNGSSEKDLKQQQKREALTKSREARAQKAAQHRDLQDPSQSTSDSSTAAIPALHVVPLPAKPDGRNNEDLLGPSVPYDGTSAAPVEGLPVATAQTGHIPGLYLSSTDPIPTINSRKRPVAADFVDYPIANTYKRPFGHNRQDRPLVIDVSDGSDDEDVEMEIGSPADEPSAMPGAGSPSHKLGSFRDFPPLSDAFSSRQYSSPAPVNLVTPPSGVPPIQGNQGGLEAMTKQIETMRKQIALAEARRKLKNAAKVRPSLPKSNGPTPEDATESDASKPPLRRMQSVDAADAPIGRSSPMTPDASSLSLPKRSDTAHNGEESSRARRLRIASQSIPTVEARLQAKKSKLRLLQSEVARLEREVQAELAEKEKLAAEMEQLDSDPGAGAEDSSGKVSKAASAEPFEAAYQPSINSQHTIASPAVPNDLSTGIGQHSARFHSSIMANAAALPLDEVGSRSEPRNLETPGLDAEMTELPEGVVENETSAELSKQADLSVDIDSAVEEVVRADSRPISEPTEVEAVPSDSASDISTHEPELFQSQSPDLEQDAVSDDYQPPASNPSNDVVGSELDSDLQSPVHHDGNISLEMNDTDIQDIHSDTSPLPAQISTGVNELTPEEGIHSAREVHIVQLKVSLPYLIREQVDSERQTIGLSKSIFTPYESPLQSFRAYRYHPKYRETVAGGLRSLTYSNKIDAKVPVCPYQLDGQVCPKGRDCEYQHFESMKLPDDQILLQLGSTTLEGAEKATFNNGLRELLHDLRSRNIKDFPSIAQGIVDYHNRVSGDPSKILPLGDITI